MGLKSVLSSIVNGPFRYKAGPRDTGVGVENLALVNPGQPLAANYFAPRYNIQRTMEMRFPTVPNTGQYLPENDLRANGVYLSGTFELAGLVQDYYDRESESQ